MVDHSQAVFGGFDVSPNHGAAVFRDIEGRLLCQSILTHLKRWKKALLAFLPDDVHGYLRILPDEVPKTAPETIEVFEARRLQVLDSWANLSVLHGGHLDGVSYTNTPPSAGIRQYPHMYCAIEEAALSQAGLYDIGQATGVVKNALFRRGVNLRGHDPKTVKKYGTGAGDASKEDVARILAEGTFQPVDYRPLIDGRFPPGEDLADADVLCRMARTEYRLRHGLDTLEGLPECQVHAFIVTSVNRKVNVLAREWASAAVAERMVGRQQGVKKC